MAARLNLIGEGGRAALERARSRSSEAVLCSDEVSEADAATLARVSLQTIQMAWKRGELPTVSTYNFDKVATLSAADVRAWAKSKVLIP